MNLFSELKLGVLYASNETFYIFKENLSKNY